MYVFQSVGIDCYEYTKALQEYHYRVAKMVVVSITNEKMEALDDRYILVRDST